MRKIFHILLVISAFCVTSCAIEKSGPYGEYSYKKVDLSKIDSLKKGTSCESKYFDPSSNVETIIGRMIPNANTAGRISEVMFLEYSYKEYVGVYKEYCLTSYGK